ncbi:hypothetical protein GALMADRAFT_138307 [Galerina marginata CBS 339.88]|uniref:Uncharacterized protein n=1 Tax=Galerina marginata (strain CBS 339.88) TaxID=685588 RepID=A0A067T4R2_GALM3|nr:hypothetical protein GALMADRAFT_138307 [Galerina marginata CBS 339.88]
MAHPITDFRDENRSLQETVPSGRGDTSQLHPLAVSAAVLDGWGQNAPTAASSSHSRSPRFLLEALVRVAYSERETELRLQPPQEETTFPSLVTTRPKENPRLRLRSRVDKEKATSASEYPNNGLGRSIGTTLIAKEKNISSKSRTPKIREMKNASHRRQVVTRPKRARNMSETFRKVFLSQHPFVIYFCENAITCALCCRNIKLDARRRYYPGFAIKHFTKCKELDPGNPASVESESLSRPIYRGGYSGEIPEASIQGLKGEEASSFAAQPGEVVKLQRSGLNPYCSRYYATHPGDAICDCKVHLNLAHESTIRM